jgi:hypothetical protein
MTMVADVNLSAWISAISAFLTIAGTVFMCGVAWSRGRIEGHVDAIRTLISAWRQEDAGRWTDFKQSVDRRMERIEDRINDEEPK